MDQKMSISGVKDDSFTKSEDEFSLSDGGDSLLNKAVFPTHFNFENVRFTPRVIEFVDAFEGKQFSVKITIQNVGRNPVWVKIGEPNSFIFQLKKPSRRNKFLASGACITKSINYTYHNVDLIQKSQIPVQINGHFVDYPIVVKKAVPDIEVKPQKLDFQIINLGASAKTLVLNIRNKGGKRTKFKVDVGKNILDLVVTPMRGTIRPNSEVNVLVEMMGLKEGDYYHEIWIKTNELPIRIPVLVKVVRPRLEILYPNGTEDFTLINFNPTFNGTQKAQAFILKNCSMDITLFNTLAEVNGELQVLANARSTTDAFNMFTLTAEEGRLEPFENRICTVLFRPKPVVTKKSWHHKEDEKKDHWEHIVFLRINRVQRIERRELGKVESGPVQHKGKSKGGQSSATHMKLNRVFEFAQEREEESGDRRINFFTESCLPEEKVLRLCLHGNAVAPDFLIQPTSFEFGDVNLGQTVDKVLRVTNNTIIPVMCRLCKTMNVKVSPAEAWLKSERAFEFVVSLSPRSAGKFKAKMKVHILAQSDVVFDTDKSLEIIAEQTVILNYTANNVFSVPGPKIGLGITPLMTDEAGFQKDLITFKHADKIPFAAALTLKKGFKTAWMNKEEGKLNRVDNAIVALPNDRPRLFYTWPKDKICRAIFSGFFRYSPPEDLTYTLSPQERDKKKEQNHFWTDYLTLLKKLRKAKYPSLKELMLCKEYNISCKNHYNMNHIRVDSGLDSSIGDLKSFQGRFKGNSKDLPDYTFVPLSPMLLSNVTVEPKFINFDQVAVNTMAQREIRITNMNDFAISIKFASGKSAVSVLADTITIEPSAIKRIQVLFQTKDLGRYFGFLNYVINGSHEFKITISAFVTSKTLSLEDSPVNIQFGLYDSKEAFQPRSVFLTMKNLLQSPIKYHWNTSPDSAFVINITEGEIPPRSSLLAEVLFDVCPRKSFYSEMLLISESTNSEAVKLVHMSKKVAVNFLSSRVDMHDIPLNLPTKVKAVIQNACYHEVVFEVLDANPVPGITVEPKQGLIKARSFFPLTIKVQIPVVMKFNFSVVLMVHFVNRISVKITGNVVAPVIRMKPSEVVMRKICAHSIDTFAICVENVGTTPAEILVDFRNCPEYKIADNNQKLYLLPRQSSKFLIQFEPTDVSRYMFYLPVTVNRILGPPEMQEPETEYVHFYTGRYESLYEQHGEVFDSFNSGLKIPCVCLNSTVTPSLLSISSPKVNFALQSESSTKFQPQDIVFTNDFNDDITFCIRNDDLGENNDSPFNLIPVSGGDIENRLRAVKVRLKQDEHLVMRATFEPRRPGTYSVEVPIFVKGYSNGLVYNFISLKGVLKPPRINPEATQIHFPPLPLDVGCDVIVGVCAENYRTPDSINCIVYDAGEEAGENLSQHIQTKWLNEPRVSPCQKAFSFQLQINFRSCVPVALKNYILLFDSMGTYSSILVTGIADNSVLTAHAFLSTRSTKYRLIRDKPPQVWKKQNIPDYPIYKSNLKVSEKNIKEKKTGSKVAVGFPTENLEANNTNNTCTLQIDKGPRLIIQETKSMTRSTQLGFVNVPKHPVDCKTSSSTFLYVTKSRLMNSFISKPESITGSKTHLNASWAKRTELMNDVSYPNFPIQEGQYKKHFEETRRYAERWIFEVVMRCDQHLSIPASFQRLTEHPRKPSKKDKDKVVAEQRVEKDFLDFLQKIVGPDPSLPKWPVWGVDSSPGGKAIKLHSIYSDILRYLENRGCLLPHVKPEFLMNYEDYILCTSEHRNIETFSWKSIELGKINSLRILQDVSVKTKPEKEGVTQKSSSIFSPRDSWKKSLFEGYLQASETEIEKTEERNPEPTESTLLKQKLEPLRDLVVGRQFMHTEDVLDKHNFDLRSTQAWLDVVIQVFRVFAMKNIVPKNTIPQVSVIEMGEKISVQTTDFNCFAICQRRYSDAQPGPIDDSNASNVYTLQERILMDWLNYHCQIQNGLLWGYANKTDSLPCGKIVNNFDKDLSDSVALISVTASHCPYIVSDYFADVFHKPDTPNKTYHNAGRLIQAWRILEIGLSVETADIVQPNPVFMVMLVARLYDVLPSLHPHSLICFSTPLTTETKRVIQLRNDSQERVVYKAKFFGDHEGFFKLDSTALIDLKPQKTTDVPLTFMARKIRRTSATLVFSGCCVSPNFGKHLAFYLEGEPSELPERDKYCFSAPLYKVVCTSVLVKPPLPDPATYEVWYTTQRPEYSESRDISAVVKPWSKIKNRKVSRRLFLNQSEVSVDADNPVASLSVAIACLTDQNRLFWLLFRSKVCDFFLQIEIKPRLADPQVTISGFYSEGWSSSATCLCSDGNHLRRPNNASSASGCPFLTELKIPARNDVLWNALWAMFLKTLQPHEKSFWKEHFEMDIGICLILWLLSPEEEESVIDEFIHALPTRMTYTLKVEPPMDMHVIVPPSLEISDVREKSEVSVPIHISKTAPSTLLFKLTLTSENGKEIRSLAIQVKPREGVRKAENCP